LAFKETAMKGDAKVIQHLNKVLFNELTAINQYFLHARMFGNWGLRKLEDYEKKESIDEMKHADRLVERILFLEGVPNIAAYDKTSIGATVKQQFENDLGLEQAALTVLKPGIKTCLDAQDDATRELLEDLSVDEERHIDWLETQLHQIQEIGYENYLAQQIFKKS
jgi:bacterioferritin